MFEFITGKIDRGAVVWRGETLGWSGPGIVTAGQVLSTCQDDEDDEESEEPLPGDVRAWSQSHQVRARGVTLHITNNITLIIIHRRNFTLPVKSNDREMFLFDAFS